MEEEATYVCAACGEENVTLVDATAGESQRYVEDCAACCRPNVIHVAIGEDGAVELWSEAES
ncbi:MAG: CPXCG motif-containing cysteine-rich protein [Candidatus Methylomirabilis sp.]|nr:CPXCG motif-containing cysteine-rich protein [Deltaproteobacteria bacterium]